MSRLRVDLAGLAALADRMAAVEALLARVREDVGARTAVLDWQGAAAVRHRDAQARWAAGADLLHGGLADLRFALAVAHGNYRAAAEANRRIWQG